MIKTYNMLAENLKTYSDIHNKIIRLTKAQELIKLTKGLYTTNDNYPGYIFAGAIYGPSYLSFDYALSYYGLIPEAVYTYTSATFEKGKTKKYSNAFGNYIYRDIPSLVFPYEIKIIYEGDYIYRMASPEKAICDKLYSLSPVSNKKELLKLLFEDLRIDEDKFYDLDKNIIKELCDLYKSKNLKLLKTLVR